MTHPLRIAVLLSGSGRTLQNLIDERAAGRLEINIALTVASRPGLAGTDRALHAGLRHAIVDRRACADVDDFSRQIFSLCDEVQPDLICMAGWLHLLSIPHHYIGKILNIHPSLLPSFGGKGMYGNRVHQAVIDYGCKVSGCTVHFVDATYDTGPIVLQRTCPVLDDDTADDLAHRVFEEEKIAFPQAIRLFQRGALKAEGRRVRLTSSAGTSGA